ncbi:PKD domain-containing protein [Kitasatospora sp. NPDC002227]|uniref:PKD domain-containing protein n=1 Tax=Kitasatospora sp. NPDC002227 TaxID=3154773 RepID=UPI00331CB390
MRLRTLACLAAAATVGLGLQLPGPAAAGPAVIYVDNGAAAHCSDSGTGTAAQPFCTVQAAADAVRAGQTVLVASGVYPEHDIRVTHSGLPGSPIVFQGRSADRGAMPRIAGPGRGFLLDGVHDVTVSRFVVNTDGQAAVLHDTDHVTLDGNTFSQLNAARAWAEVEVGGAATATTISRNIINTDDAGAVTVGAGATGTTVTTNQIYNEIGVGVQVTDAPGTVVTSNTVSTGCAVAVGLFGDSSKSVVENNVLATDRARSGQPSCATLSTELAVSAASVAGTKADWNLTYPPAGEPAYIWAGKAYPTAVELAKAVPGQAAHELTEDPKADPDFPGGLQEGSPLIDSADAAAPGELATDVSGFHRVDDPTVANTGTGAGTYDRGAGEFTPVSSQLLLEALPSAVPLGEALTFSVNAFKGWSPHVSYRYDFGDGSAVTTAESMAHTYRATGTYHASVTATLENGDSTSATTDVTVSPPGPLTAGLRVDPADHGLIYTVQADGTSPWQITGRSVDFGDGSAPCTALRGSCEHSYHQDGDVTVTATVTDAGGRTATARQALHVAYQPSAFYPLAPTRVADTRLTHNTLGAGRTLTLPLLNLSPRLPFAQTPDAVVLNVTAVAHDAGGYLTVYPGNATQPHTSNLNFAAGRAVPNVVTVPIGPDGTIEIFNKFGDTDVVVDISGYYSTHTAGGSRYTPLAPSRLLDTRKSGAIGPGGETVIPVHAPAGATAAVLNVTATGSDTGGYFTAYPSGTARPGTSNLNFGAGQTVANQVIVPIGADGTVKLYNFAGHAHAVVDLFGWYSPGSPELYQPVSARRLLDTRTTTALGPHGSVEVTSAAPAGTKGAVLNLTAVQPTAPGYLTVWSPDDTHLPFVSNLNFVPGQVVANQVTTQAGPDGSFDVYNFSGTTQVVADLSGWFRESTPPNNGAK